jgi:hypothetical protein
MARLNGEGLGFATDIHCQPQVFVIGPGHLAVFDHVYGIAGALPLVSGVYRFHRSIAVNPDIFV